MPKGRRAVSGFARVTQHQLFPTRDSKTRSSSTGPCPESPINAHHWQIAPYRSPTSDAVCLYCRAKRSFSNVFGSESH